MNTVTCTLCRRQIEPPTEKAMSDHLYDHVILGVQHNESLRRVITALKNVSDGADYEKFFKIGEHMAQILKGKF